MPRKCIVCNKFYTSGSDETFHTFPKDTVRKQLWLKACKIKLYLPSYCICGDHFLPKHYLPSGYLKKDAIPFLPSTSTNIESLDHHSTSRSCPSPTKLPCVEHVVSMSTDIDHSDHPVTPCTITSNPCESPVKRHRIFNASTIGSLSLSHFSSPKMAKRHLDMVKNKFKEKQVENHNLKRQLKRLKKKVERDQDCIQSLNRQLQKKEYDKLSNAKKIGVLSPNSCQSPVKCKKVLNTNTLRILSPIRSVGKSKRNLDNMMKCSFKEKQVQNENLKNQIKILKNIVQQDHDYV